MIKTTEQVNKVCLITTQLGMGGAETQVCALADGLSQNGFRVIIINMIGEPVVRPKDASVEVLNLYINKRKPASLVIALFKLNRFLRNYKAEIVHSHAVHANILARLLRINCRFPVLISTAHSTNEGGYILNLLYRLTDRLSDLTTNVSDEAVQVYIQKNIAPKDKIIRVYNGIDVEKFKHNLFRADNVKENLGISSNEIMVLAVGRLAEEKDYPNLFDAIKILEEESGYIFRICIVGQGHLEAHLKTYVKHTALRSKVDFLGIRRDIPDLMSAANLFVLPSAWEGFGLVVAEAMACECIVVATDSGGVREVVADEGFLCPPRNAPALAQAIQQAVELDDKRQMDLQHRARRRIEQNFSIDIIVMKWSELYTQFFNAKKRMVNK